MAAGHFAATTPKPIRLIQSSYLLAKPNPTIFFPPSNLRHQKSALHYRARRKLCFTVYVVMEDQKQSTHLEICTEKAQEAANSQIPIVIPSVRVAEKLSRKKSERFTYLVAAVMSSFGITSMAVMGCLLQILLANGVADSSFNIVISANSLALSPPLAFFSIHQFLYGLLHPFLSHHHNNLLILYPLHLKFHTNSHCNNLEFVQQFLIHNLQVCAARPPLCWSLSFKTMTLMPTKELKLSALVCWWFFLLVLTKGSAWVIRIRHVRGGNVPLSEMLGTFALSVGAAVISLTASQLGKLN
ncbi:unnamed protein product [Prunus armeniaca]|uniref:beta-carotene 3-hydroxylase n=1 Tax=Prunus armeniaca TaxID=36596 RepID=A0A6J5VV88_PRUAR|nr:unnamed protein product [Prunus armeniaca]